MPEIRVIEPVIFPSVDKLRVCAYARVSSDSEDQYNSFTSQVHYYTKYIQAHEDWQFVDIYADQGITGTSACKREEFLRLMRDCRQGKIDRIPNGVMRVFSISLQMNGILGMNYFKNGIQRILSPFKRK